MSKSLFGGLFERFFRRVSGSNIADYPQKLLNIFKHAHERDLWNDDTVQRIENIIKFNEMAVRDAMIPRAQMDVIKTTDSIERIMAYVVETAHSRFPVIGDDKDHVLGVLHAKDLLKLTLNPEHFKWENIIRPTLFVPEGKPLNILLKEFQEQRSHMAMVVDEYGGISGLVTFEDVIEQIVGKIEDEFDEDDDADNIFPVSAERWRIKATTEIDDINAFLGTQLSSEESDTIGGLLIETLGYLPVRGEKVVLGQWQFSVAQADKRRVHTLMASKIKESVSKDDAH